jgi:hypothetical protein
MPAPSLNFFELHIPVTDERNNVLFFQLPLHNGGVTTCLDTENTASKIYHSLRKTNVKRQDSAVCAGGTQTR